ncbi:MAG: OmpA family protein [Candidatus Aminicenantales bacterium]
MKKIILPVLIACLLMAGINCASMNRAQKGAVIGGTSGAVIGGLIGHAAGNTIVGAIIGAAVGGAAGAWIGSYMDKQAAEIQRDIQGAKVERIGEGIRITFDSGILFDVDKSELRPASQENLTEMARILNKYADTNVLIEGHTDSTGSEEHNLALSRMRAQSVGNYLAILEVNASRFSTMGYGESQPVATNDTPDGRQLNRRVDIAVMANEKLKKIAQEKAKGESLY